MTEAKESAMSLLEMFVRANENRDFFTRFSFELVEKVNEE
jgi:N-acetylglutamate synthase-like GNAT family acetyltransferase